MLIKFLIFEVDILHFAGGKTAHKAVYAQLQKLLTPEVAQRFSCLGKGGKKKPFCDLQIYHCIVGECRNFKNANNNLIVVI